jgi:hypothetical protein
LNRLSIKKNNGAALIQVLVLSGILGVISLGILHLNKNIQNVSRLSSENMEIYNTMVKIRSILQNKKICDETFKGLKPKGTTGQEIGSIKYMAQDKLIFQKNVVYGKGLGKIIINKMTIKNYNSATGQSLFQIKFQRGIKNNKFSVRRFLINTKLDKNSAISECLLDEQGFTKNTCENLFSGDFSDGVNCKSIKIQSADDKNYAIQTKGHFKIEEDLKADNKITTQLDQELEHFLRVKGTNDGGLIIGDNDQAKINVDSQGKLKINLIYTGSRIKSLKWGLSNDIVFKVSGNDLIFDGNGSTFLKLKGFKNQEDFKKSASSFRTTPEGLIATRYWFYKNLTEQLNDFNNSALQTIINNGLSKIKANDKAEDIIKSFGKNICENYFEGNYVWDAGAGNVVCKVRNLDTCNLSTYTNSKFVNSSYNFHCVEYTTSKVKSKCIKERVPCLRLRGALCSAANWLLKLFGGSSINSSRCYETYPNNPGPSCFEFRWSQLTDNPYRCGTFKAKGSL